MQSFTAKDDELDAFLGQMKEAERPNDTSKYVKVSGVVDTGADDHALTEKTAIWIKIQPSEASRAGKSLVGPGGEDIPTRGKRTLKGWTSEGQARSLAGEVCPIRKNLFSGTKIAKAGNLVVVGDDKAFLMNIKTKEVTKLRKEGKSWMLDLWLRAPAGSPRQGQ